MSRTDFRPALLLLVLALPPSTAGAAAVATISVAEQPVRLLRDTTFYSAGRGAQLQPGDIVEAGRGTLQLEAPHCCTLALGPASRIYFKTGKPFDLVLLDGWLKVQAPAGGAARISAGGLQLSSSGTFVLHAGAGKAELFVETGDPGVTDLQAGKASPPARVAHEQYAARSAGQPLKVLPRPPKEFIGAMPRAFQEILLPVAVKGAAPVPRLERRAAFADVAPWLETEPALHQALQRRFFPPKPSQPKPSPHTY